MNLVSKQRLAMTFNFQRISTVSVMVFPVMLICLMLSGRIFNSRLDQREVPSIINKSQQRMPANTLEIRKIYPSALMELHSIEVENHKSSKPIRVSFFGTEISNDLFTLNYLLINGKTKIPISMEQWNVSGVSTVTVNGPIGRIVELMDANFDGYLDLKVTASEAMFNSNSLFFLYKPATNKFVFNRQYSQISSIKLHADKKLVEESIHMGVCSEAYSYLYPVDNVLYYKKLVILNEGTIKGKHGCVRTEYLPVGRRISYVSESDSEYDHDKFMKSFRVVSRRFQD